MTPKALIFDVDGTLAETEEAHRHAFNAAFRAWDLPWNWDRDTYRALLRTTGGKERIAAYCAGLPQPERLDQDAIARLHGAKTEAYTASLQSGDLALRPGVQGLIARARAAGLRLAVATTTSLPNVDALARCCWGRPAAEVFDVIAAGDQVRAKKPAPDVFTLALDRLGLTADQALAFEDSRNGLLSAQAAGLAVIVTPSAYTDRDDFTGAMTVIPSLEPRHLPGMLTFDT